MAEGGAQVRRIVKAFALLTAAVLVVIGVGVGFVAGIAYPQPPLKIYGSGPVAFEAAFPTLEGPRRFNVPPPIAWQSKHRPVGLFVYQAWNNGPDGWMADVTIYRLNTRQGSVLWNVEKKKVLSPYAQYYQLSSTHLDGAAVMIGKTTCQGDVPGLRAGICSGFEILQRGNVVWVVQGYSAATIAQVAGDFVGSFRPIGS